MQLHLCSEALVLRPHLHFDFYLKTRIKVTIKNKTIRNQYSAVQYSTVKGKAVPLQAWSGPEGSRKLWLPHFVTTAQDGGKVVSLTHWLTLPPGNTPGTHFC